MTNPMDSRKRPQPGEKLRAADKVARIPVNITPTEQPMRKPRWIRAQSQAHHGVQRIKRILREQRLHTVCEEASCPNLGECFAHGTATFMIMGDICTRRCPFCDVAHGKPPWLALADLGEVFAQGAFRDPRRVVAHPVRGFL